VLPELSWPHDVTVIAHARFAVALAPPVLAASRFAVVALRRETALHQEIGQLRSNPRSPSERMARIKVRHRPLVSPHAATGPSKYKVGCRVGDSNPCRAIRFVTAAGATKSFERFRRHSFRPRQRGELVSEQARFLCQQRTVRSVHRDVTGPSSN
jgi:hypothetical protein